MSDIAAVHESDPDLFANKCQEYIDEGYIISSTGCGFVDSAEYDFCGSYHAVLVKKDKIVS